MDVVWLAQVLNRAFIAGTPLLLGTLGEIVTERSGVLNLGMEGMMAIGAVTAFMVGFLTGQPWLGFFAGACCSAVFSLIHAGICVGLKGKQVVSGLALTMLGLGLSGLLGKAFVGKPLTQRFPQWSVPGLNRLPVLGEALFTQDPLFYFSLLCALLVWILIYRTRWGMQLRAVGENPVAADAMGISVGKMQTLAIMLGGFLAGCAGAYISLVYMPTWMEGIIGGRGWIVIALTIFAGWNPIKAFGGSYLFGGIYVLQYLLQPFGFPPNLLMMLPYLSTIGVLIIGSRQARISKKGAPAHLGETFIKAN